MQVDRLKRRPRCPARALPSWEGIGISDDHCYVYFRNGFVSAGTSRDLDRYRSPYRYSLPFGISSPDKIIEISIAKSGDDLDPAMSMATM